MSNLFYLSFHSHSELSSLPVQFHSPLTANIYFPAIPQLADAFHRSTEDIDLTVTVYMIVQGIAPTFWGNFADRKGRRPSFIVCLLILAFACLGIARTPTKDYWLLIVLRCLQAAGSASTIALCMFFLLSLS